MAPLSVRHRSLIDPPTNAAQVCRGWHARTFSPRCHVLQQTAVNEYAPIGACSCFKSCRPGSYHHRALNISLLAAEMIDYLSLNLRVSLPVRASPTVPARLSA